MRCRLLSICLLARRFVEALDHLFGDVDAAIREEHGLPTLLEDDGVALFPAELITPPILKAIRVVLPKGTRLLPVGGITPDNMKPYRDAGAAGFGLGSALYSPGISTAELAERAGAFVAAWKQVG